MTTACVAVYVATYSYGKVKFTYIQYAQIANVVTWL